MRSTPSTSAAAIALISAASVTSSHSGADRFVSAFVPTCTSENSAFFSRPTYANAAEKKRQQSKSKSKSTKLSFGMNDNADTPLSKKKRGEINPENIQAYIAEPSESRTRQPAELGPTVLVSGFVDPASPTLGRDSDQTIFDLLNDPSHESGLDFESIVAFVPDASFAKKRLVSRTSRYSGLLNKLSFAEAEADAADDTLLPSSEQLDGVTTWVARIESADPAHNLDTINKIVHLSKTSSTVRNVALLLCDASSMDVEAALNTIKTLTDNDGGMTYTVVAVGKTDGEIPEATLPYAVADLFAPTQETTTTTAPAPGDTGLHYAAAVPATTTTFTAPIPSDAIYSREESLRLLTTCLGLECGRNRALAFTAVDNVNATSYKLVKGLREAGYTWSQELEHMVENGVEVRKIV